MTDKSDLISEQQKLHGNPVYVEVVPIHGHDLEGLDRREIYKAYLKHHAELYKIPGILAYRKAMIERIPELASFSKSEMEMLCDFATIVIPSANEQEPIDSKVPSVLKE